MYSHSLPRASYQAGALSYSRQSSREAFLSHQAAAHVSQQVWALLATFSFFKHSSGDSHGLASLPAPSF